MDLLKRVLDSIIKDGLIKTGDTVVVGVSGGPDSVTLLHVLYQLRHRLGINLHVAHFNHRLRPTADADEAFVKGLADRLGLPISVSYRKGRSKSRFISEDKARQLRFQFFGQVAHRIKAQSVALAHTQNDLAETVLMRLLRGTGLLGLRGVLSEHHMAGTKFIRPFLSIQRSQIEGYLKTYRLNYCTDETNKQTHYLRNKIRLKLFPSLIKEYNVNLPHVLVDLACTTQADYDYLLNQAQGLFKQNASVSKTKVRIKMVFFFRQHLCMQRMLLRLSFEHLTADFKQLNFLHIQEVEDMLYNRPIGSIVHWPKSVQALKSKDELVLKVL